MCCQSDMPAQSVGKGLRNGEEIDHCALVACAGVVVMERPRGDHTQRSPQGGCPLRHECGSDYESQGESTDRGRMAMQMQNRQIFIMLAGNVSGGQYISANDYGLPSI